MIVFVHALWDSKIVHTGHHGLWQSTEAVVNAVLEWRRILAKPHMEGILPHLMFVQLLQVIPLHQIHRTMCTSALHSRN